MKDVHGHIKSISSEQRDRMVKFLQLQGLFLHNFLFHFASFMRQDVKAQIKSMKLEIVGSKKVLRVIAEKLKKQVKR